jgi:hypothetical protein
MLYGSLFKLGDAMDLKQYFRKVRQVEASITDTFPLVISLETPDGGKPGLASEVSREQAAKMIVEGRAMLASEEEKELYRQQQAQVKRAAEKAEMAKRLQVAIISEADLRERITSTNDDPFTTGE